MRIGELAEKTGVPARMLRYYEQQGLMTPLRSDNGYREYDQHLLERVHKIRGLLDSGIPTRIIQAILPCIGQSPEIIVEDAAPELRDMLTRQRDKMIERIRFLEQSRDALTHYIRTMDHHRSSREAS